MEDQTAGSRLPRWLALGVLALGAQLVVVHVVAPSGAPPEAIPFLLVASHLVVLPFLFANLSFYGVRLVLVGLLLNLMVMTANGGLMPADRDAVAKVGRHEVTELQVGSHIPGTKNVLLDPSDVRLRGLSDIIVVPFPRPLTKVVSIGDVLVFAGVTVAYFQIVRRNLSRARFALNTGVRKCRSSSLSRT